MKLVALETSGPHATVCLADSGTVVEQRTLSPRNTAAELVPVLRDRLATAGWSWPMVELIAVTCGPGSFTGVRVGMATAKGLAEARSTPLLAVSSLELLRAQVPDLSSGCVLLDAGRGEFYAGRFEQDAWEERLVTRDELRAFAHDAPLLTADPSVQVAVEALFVPPPDAAALARLASAAFETGRRTDPATLDANYLRRSDAEVKLDAGLLG